MISHVEDAFTIGVSSISAPSETSDAWTDTEDPFVMGRTLLILAVFELIIGVGVYRFIS